jgi:hypothetical protein
MSIRKINRIKRKQSSLTSGKHWCDGCDANLVHANEKCPCGWHPGNQVKKRDFYFEEVA